jgi:O-methyltransferase
MSAGAKAVDSQYSKLASQSGSTILRVRHQNNFFKRILKKIAHASLAAFGYQLRSIRLPNEEKFNIPDRELYRPLFSPWFAAGDFEKYFSKVSQNSLVAADACFVIWTLLRQSLHLPGDVWECGVYRGGTSSMIAAVLKDSASDKKLYLFDTFTGLPESDPSKDTHVEGEFCESSLETVKNYIGCEEYCVMRPGLIPDTFIGLESSQIALAHIDVVLYKATLDSIAFIWPRIVPGGFIIFDDYGFGSCPGARAAVDEYFSTEACIPLCLPTGQAIVFKSLP